MKRAGGTGTGFTLIEIMVALAVFALAAMALLRLEGQTIRSTGILRDTWMAQAVARNVAIEAVTDPQPPNGQAQGVMQEGDGAWRWTRSAQPVGDAGVVRIDVAVADARGGPTIGRATMVRAPFEQASVQR